MRFSSVALTLSATLAAMLLSGCGGFAPSTTPIVAKTAGVAMKGKLYGGQQPIVGAAITLYQAGASGYGLGATSLLTRNVVTGSDGSFDTGAFSCASGSQLYLTASGGNAGGGTNTAIALMAALGLCDNVNSIPFVAVNEITTVGTVWALSPFMSGAIIGAPGSNQAGLATAFADIAQIVDITKGSTPGPMLPTSAVAPTTEINTLADILASCINSAGSSSSQCTALFGYATPPAGGSMPQDTLAAAIDIARNPGANVTNLINQAGPTAPFQPTLGSAADLTLGVTYPVGNAPAALAVDASSNVWVANNGSNSVSKLTHAGTATTYTAGSISQPTGIAIDTAGNAWIGNTNNTITELTSSGSNVSGSPYSGGGLNTPTGIAIDGLGMVWVSNGAAKTVSAFSSAGAAISTSTGYAAGNTTGSGEVGVAINPH